MKPCKSTNNANNNEGVFKKERCHLGGLVDVNAISPGSWQRMNWNCIVVKSNIPKARLGIVLQFC